MMEYMKSWVQELGHNQRAIIARLSKESVRAQNNTRASQGVGASTAQGQPGQIQQAQQSIQGFMQGIPGVSQMQGLLNMTGGTTGIGREGPSEQSGYLRPEISASHGSAYSTGSNYAPPLGPSLPVNAYSSSPPYGQPSQSGPLFPAQNSYASSYAQAPSTTSFPGANNPYAQSTPGGYPGVPTSSNTPPGGYQSPHGTHLSSYPPGGPPSADFGGFPGERHAPHGHGHGHGHGSPEELGFGGRPRPPFPDNRQRFDERGGYPAESGLGGRPGPPFPDGRQRFDERGGYPPRSDPYDWRR